MWFWPPFSEGVIHWLFIQENIIDVAGYQFNESLRLVKGIVSWLCLNCSVTWLYPNPTLLWSLLNILSPNCSLVSCGEPGNEATLTGQTILCCARNLCVWKDWCLHLSLCQRILSYTSLTMTLVHCGYGCCHVCVFWFFLCQSIPGSSASQLVCCVCGGQVPGSWLEETIITTRSVQYVHAFSVCVIPCSNILAESHPCIAI